MEPPVRQHTRTSTHSWWSDSNSLLVYGPTINLHAAAKPLLRFMYRRQAVGIIRGNRDSPLSTTILEIYSSYLPWNYVSWSTKSAILADLTERARSSEVEARAVVDSPVFPCIVQMLGSPDPRLRSCSCRLLGGLASNKFTAPAILELETCARVVSLLHDKQPEVRREAMSVLCEIADSVDGAQAVSPSVRLEASKLAGRLARHESTAEAVLKLRAATTILGLSRPRTL
ncbi:hypothetical protein B0H14DRAFT_2582206 [Mycena olivaceomarginata]|nr:hypothetical protein B0H14DRAFT_2582206 [Mycena olivaceomarginata]